MIILLFFAFLSGMVTIAAPCIWPLLPIILSATTTGGHKKPLGITLGIMLSFGLLTLTISYIVKIIPFDPNTLRFVAVLIIGFLGLTLIIPALSTKLEALVSRFSGKITFGRRTGSPSDSASVATSAKEAALGKEGFWSGFITGLALGIVWTPCAGPILATIATLAATTSVNMGIILVTLVYVLGVGIPLFFFATLGRYVFAKTRVFSRYSGKIQQVFGIIMILTAVAIATNYDRVLQTKLLSVFPSYSNFLTQLESNSAVKTQLNELKNQKSLDSLPSISGLFNTNQPAPDFVGITHWLNMDTPLSLKDLKGKVVLVDFWTYTCINCIRTLPHVTHWYDTYKDQGFVVVGVHTPEFAFEKDTGNVANAITQYAIHYPVAQDNNYATWNAYSNQYWPAEYLIDSNGVVRRVHFGEGEYDEMEQAIRTLLQEAGKKITTPIQTMPDETPTGRPSAETYLGSSRMQFYYPGGSIGNGTHTLQLATNIPQNTFSLGGTWTIDDENATAGKNAILTYHFYAKQVYLVLRPSVQTPATVKIFVDGKEVLPANQGKDVTHSQITVTEDRLYHLLTFPDYEIHTLRLEFTPGIRAFAFTFG